MCQGGGIFAEGRGKLASRFRGGKKNCRQLLGGAKKNFKSSYFNPNTIDMYWALIDMCIVPLYCGYIVNKVS